MKKIILSLAMIAAMAALAVGATTAYFSDVETSKNNTFTAGNLDLKIDSTCHYNGMVCALSDGEYVWQDEDNNPNNNVGYPVAGTPCSCSWVAKDLGGDRFFDFTDVKPGDKGENTISIQVDNNDAWGQVTITALENREHGCTEPERDVDSTCVGQWCGELAQNTEVRIWIDNGVDVDGNPIDGAAAGDNIYQSGEVLLTGTQQSEGWQNLFPLFLVSAICGESGGEPNYTPNTSLESNFVIPEKLTSDKTYYIGVEWRIPDDVNNIIQGDSMKADIKFEITQARHQLTNPYLPY